MKKIILSFLIAFSISTYGQSILMQNGTFNVCVGQFESSTGFGSGGAGTPGYLNNENYVITFCPGLAGNVVSINFASCVLGTGDVLTIYNGNSTAAPILGVYDATNPLFGIVSAISSTNPSGCITFQFVSDASIVANGWTGFISCTIPCQAFEVDWIATVPDTSVGAYIDVCNFDTVQIDVTGNYLNNNLNYNQNDSNVNFYWYNDTTLIDSGTTVFIPADTAGAFLIQVYATDSLGCTANFNLNYWIRVATNPDFSPSYFEDDTICYGSTNVLNFGAVSQSWSNADSTTSVPTTFLPDGTGSAPGVYVNTLTFSKFPTGDTISSMADIDKFWVLMEHSFLGDLTISMTCPNGSSTILKSFPGGGGTNLGEPCTATGPSTGIGNGYLYEWFPTGNNQTNMTAYACGCPAVTNPCTGTSAGASLPADSYNSSGAMSSMIGCPLNGTWSLTIVDQWGQDDGYLFSWGVQLDSSLYPNTVITYDPGIDSMWVDTSLLATTVYSTTDTLTVLPSVDSTTLCYTVNVLDGFGCTHDTTICFFVRDMCDPVCYTPISPIFTNKKVSCPGGNDGELYAAPVAMDMPAPWTYIWTNSSGGVVQTTVASMLPDTVIGLTIGVYSLEIIDGNGCTSTWQTYLGAVNAMQVTVTGVTQTSCATATCDATAISVVFFGSSPYSYQWSSGDTTSGASTLCVGLNYLFVTDVNGCVDTSTFTVGAPLPVTTAAYGDTTICISNLTSLGTNTSGGTQPYSYNWNAGLGSAQTINVSPGLTQTYMVVVTDANNCTPDTSEVTVTVRPPLSLSFPTPDTLCPGDSALLIAIAHGGDSIYSYAWNQGLGFNSTALTQVSVSSYYQITLTDACGTTPVADSVWLQVGGYPPLKVDINPDDSICEGDPFFLFAKGIGGDRKFHYLWDNNLGNGPAKMVKPTKTTAYSVTVTDECFTPSGVGIVNVSVGNIENFEAWVDTIENCDPGSFVFGFDTLDTKFIYQMNFGQGYKTVDVFAPIERTFTEDGCHDLRVKLTSDFGCVTEKVYPCLFTVLPKPIANFDFNPHKPNVHEFSVDFWDKSTGATNWNWYSNNILVSEEDMFTKLFPDSGRYNIMLVVTNEHGCIDSTNTDMPVLFETSYFLPTGFTPNGDGINDVFNIVGEGLRTEDFELIVFDRWGGEVFRTTDLDEGWDGTVQGSEELLMNGSYAYSITFRIDTGRKITEFGQVNLLK